MARGFTVELEGLQETINRLKKAADDIAKEVDDELAAGTELMARSAKRLVASPGVSGTGRLRNAISASRVGFLTMELVAQTEYAAYIEFGTGTLVDVPPGLEEYAMQFKGANKRQVNLLARPYFFRSVNAYLPQIVKNIKDILNEKR